MRRVIIVLSICAMALFLTGCREVKEEFSDTLHEDAVVSDAVYTPSRHDTQLDYTATDVGPVGIGYGGDIGIRVGGGLQINTVEVPEKFAVVFKCQHGQFIVTKKNVYDNLKDHIGETVDVAYREVYRAVYDTKDNERILISRALVDYDFLTATLE